MKRIFLAITIIIAASIGHKAEAQSFQSLLKGISTIVSATKSEQAKGTTPTLDRIIGQWMYQSLEMEYSGDSTLASMAISSAKTQMSVIASKSGLVAGRDYINIKDDGTVLLVSGEHNATAKYTYQPDKGIIVVTITYKEQQISLTATVTLKNGALQVMFKAPELVATADKYSESLKENTAFQIIKTMTEQYPEITIGATFSK